MRSGLLEKMCSGTLMVQKRNGLNVTMIAITDGEIGYNVVGLLTPMMNKFSNVRRQSLMEIK